MSSNLKELKDVALVFTGLARHSGVLLRDKTGFETRMLGMKAIRDGWIEEPAIESVYVSSEQEVERYRLAENDILIPCRGTELRLSIAPARFAGLLIDSNIIAIRCGPEMLPQLLVEYFRHPRGLEALQRSSQSTTLQKNLTLRVLRKLQVPVPRLLRQQKLIALLTSAQRVHDLLMTIAEKKMMVARHIALNQML